MTNHPKWLQKAVGGRLTAASREKMSSKEFGLPKTKGFPMNDKTHDRLAISGATRSERAGNISPATADRIKAKARGKLEGKADGGPVDDKSPPNPGEVTNEQSAKYLRNKALHKGIDAGLAGLTSATAATGALLPIGKAKPFRTFMTGAALASGKAAKDNYDEMQQARREAKSFDEDEK